ncbi:MAG TPA: nuclear transport factor 2 family protein [Polyangiales bacterium]|nr:nuclear transport factor 2 family protein [Polyangiales bacterium]
MTSERDALIALEARRCEAIGTGDLEALADVLADDYLHIFATGSLANKAQYIEVIRSGPRKPERGKLDVRVYGSAAVITGDLDNHLGAPGDVQRIIAAYCTQVAVREGGKWRFVSYILTRKRELH